MRKRAISKAQSPIAPTEVRYIKLGRQGRWETECIKNGVIRYGYDSADEKRYRMCHEGRWDALYDSFIAAKKKPGVAKRFTNETQKFFEDRGTTLWVTFVGESLYWGFLDSSPAKQHHDGHGVSRKLSNGWKSKDINGENLTKDRLSGALTQLVGFRGTSCKVGEGKYVIDRINGLKSPIVERALAATREMRSCAVELMKRLTPGDFETLVDLVFSTSGWRRIGNLGKTQKTLDLDLILPSTGERAFVQVKSKTTSKELAAYVKQISNLRGYKWMFYVYHSGEAETLDDRVKVIDPEKLAQLILDAGLITWLINKVS